MALLTIFRGDMVKIKGKRSHDTVCIVLGDSALDDSSVRQGSALQLHTRRRACQLTPARSLDARPTAPAHTHRSA